MWCVWVTFLPVTIALPGELHRRAVRVLDLDSVGKLALQVGKGCAEIHDRHMVG
jgi:hypothetical protein